MTAGASTDRTVVLGFDALDATYLDRFSESLPNFTRLREDGVERSLESTLPPWTGSAWPSMYTGVDPSHHGVFDFFDRDGYPDEGEVVSRNDVGAPALWNYLSSVDVPSVVCNVPVTHPAEPIDGVVVPGYLASEDAPGHPEGVREELSAAIGEEYRIYSRAEMASDDGEKLAGYLDLIDLRRRAALALLEGRDWQFALLQVQKTDAVFHNFEDEDAFRAVYEAADAFVGSVLDAVDDSVTVIVCSDHGIGPVSGYRIHVNQVLQDHGFLETAADSEQRTLQTEKRALVGEGTGARDASETDRTAVLPRLVEELDRVGITPARVYAAAERLGVEDALVALTPATVGSAVSETVDWAGSKAYCEKSTQLGVRINLAGREPDGAVPESEYDDLRRTLIDLLSDLRTPDGEPAFETVVPRETVYDGPHLDRAPDVFAVPTGMNHSISTALYGRAFTPVDKHDHKRDGVFIGAGPVFDDATAGSGIGDVGSTGGGEHTGNDGRAEEPELSLVDVAPIVVASLGRPVPARMTGRAPPELLTVPVERRSYDDVPYGTQDADEHSEEAVTERLEDLGYL